MKVDLGIRLLPYMVFIFFFLLFSFQKHFFQIIQQLKIPPPPNTFSRECYEIATILLMCCIIIDSQSEK